MHVLYLSEANLRDRLFIQQLVSTFSFSDKVLVLLEPFGANPTDSRFVTRRFPTLFAEASNRPVYALAFTGDQRNLVHQNDDGSLKLRTELIEQLMQPVEAFVLGPIADSGSGAVLVSGEDMLGAVRSQLSVEEVFVFPDNPLSPLGQKRLHIQSGKEIEPLLATYEEEAAALHRAAKLAPVRLVAPGAYDFE